ncbi:TonB-dependent receptor [Portibacter lacus]|uniref:TonB-dependent receptor n=1 Tax=Portibacter lacus TaxID=1099794 RepID=A0AA37WBC6_9BACT|nr:hypothetical protein [Portibacter lacus]GLR15491.1 TonB-dependent receptor [Portibacter lacus]
MNKIIWIGIFVFVGQCLNAQTPDSIKNLPAEQVEVIKQFEARLEDARKVNTLPEPPAQRVLEKFNYSVNIRPIELAYLDPVIRPVAIPAKAKPIKYNGFVRAGGGNLNTLDAGLGYHFVTRNETGFTVNADYLTMENKAERFQKRQQIIADIGIDHNFNALVAFGANIGYHQKDIGFYGSPLDFVPEDTTAYFRTIADYGFGFNLYNAEENEYDVNYNLGFDFKNVSLRDENLDENNFKVDARIEKNINQQFNISLDGLVDITSIIDTGSTSINNYHIKPGFAYNNEQFRFSAGVDFAFAKDKTYYLPDVEISYSLFDLGLIPYAFWNGNLQKNHMKSLVEYNPYLSASVVPDLGNTVHNFYGLGFKGTVKKLNYDAKVSYGSVADLVMFRNQVNELGLRQFVIQKDSANVLKFDVNAEYKFGDQLEMNAHFGIQDYDIYLFHIPTYQFDFGLKYYLLDQKLTINPSLYIRDGVNVFNDDFEDETLPYMLDLNLHADYKIHDQFSLYVQFNNLLGSEYQQWYDYSNFGLNIQGGLKVRF